MAGSKPFLTVFGIHHILESCVGIECWKLKLDESKEFQVSGICAIFFQTSAPTERC